MLVDKNHYIENSNGLLKALINVLFVYKLILKKKRQMCFLSFVFLLIIWSEHTSIGSEHMQKKETRKSCWFNSMQSAPLIDREGKKKKTEWWNTAKQFFPITPFSFLFSHSISVFFLLLILSIKQPVKMQNVPSVFYQITSDVSIFWLIKVHSFVRSFISKLTRENEGPL